MAKIIRARDLRPGDEFRFEDGPTLTTVEVRTHHHYLTGDSVGVVVEQSEEMLYLDYSDQVTLVDDFDLELADMLAGHP